MQRSTATFLLFVVVVLVAVVLSSGWFTDEPLPVDEVASPPPPPPAATGQASREPGEQPPAPIGAPRVVVEVRVLETFVAPPPVRVQAVDVMGTELPTVVVAGAGAGFDPGPTRAGLSLVAISHEGGTVLRQVAVTEGAVARPVVGARIVVRGTVRDPQRQPIPGARVWLGETMAGGERRFVVTGEQGAFELDVQAGTGVPFVVEADGRASLWSACAVAAPSPELAAVLHPSAPIDVQIAAVSTGIEQTRLFVVPGEAVSTELTNYPFFLQVLTDGFAVAANGTANLPGLPTVGTIGLVVRHPLVPLGTPLSVTLRNEAARVVLPLGTPVAAWHGRVVDDDGAPLPGVAVWARAPGRRLGDAGSPRLVPPHLDAGGTTFTRSDAEGMFTIGRSDAALAVVSLRAPGRAGRDVSWPPTDDAPLVLPAWRGDEPAFRLLPPKPGVAWIGECDLGGGVRAQLAADREWQVSFPHAGRFHVVVTTFDGDTAKGTWTRPVVVTGVVDLESPRLP